MFSGIAGRFPCPSPPGNACGRTRRRNSPWRTASADNRIHTEETSDQRNGYGLGGFSSVAKLGGSVDVVALGVPDRPVPSPVPAGLRRLGSELRPAAGAELGLLADHAGLDAFDVRDFGAAQAERIAHAGLLLLVGVSPTHSRREPEGKRHGWQRSDADFSGTEREFDHESPQARRAKCG